mmetsp:Transcript_18141/g.33150  ORF Transcript_18141/g.33150 Transcript_18141/m.33150 type:complete len:214 (+) Transcript_18141:126-767(+)
MARQRGWRRQHQLRLHHRRSSRRRLSQAGASFRALRGRQLAVISGPHAHRGNGLGPPRPSVSRTRSSHLPIPSETILTRHGVLGAARCHSSGPPRRGEDLPKIRQAGGDVPRRHALSHFAPRLAWRRLQGTGTTVHKSGDVRVDRAGHLPGAFSRTRRRQQPLDDAVFGRGGGSTCQGHGSGGGGAGGEKGLLRTARGASAWGPPHRVADGVG